MKENVYIQKIAELYKTREDEIVRLTYLLCESVADDIREVIQETLGKDTVCEVLFTERDNFYDMGFFVLIRNPLLEEKYNATTELERETVKWENRIEFAIVLSEKGIIKTMSGEVVFFDVAERIMTNSISELLAFIKQDIRDSWADIIKD